MELRKDISKFITQICEKNYSSANSTLETLIEKKLKAKVKKMHKACCEPCSKKKKVVKENIDDSLSIGSNDESPYDEAAELDDMEPFEEPKEKDFVIKRSAESDSPDSELTDIEQNGEHFATFANQQSAKKFLKKYMGTAGIHTNVLMKDDQGHYTSIKL